jgi:tetratricopeptide (TPR) repeat protein
MNRFLVLFAFALLFLTHIIRSEIIVDQSLLPRFFILSLILLVIVTVRFRNRLLFGNSPLEWAFLLFYLWNLLSCCWAIAPSEALMQSQMVFLGFGVFLVVKAIGREHEGFEKIFIDIQTLVVLFSFGLAIYKMTTLEFFDPYRILSISANNNLYAGYLLLSLPFLLAGYSLSTGFRKLLMPVVATGSLFFIIIVQSRAAYLGLSAALLLMAVLLMVRYRHVFSRKNILAGFLCLILLSAGIGIFYSSLDPIRRQYFLSKIPVWQYITSYEHQDVDELLEEWDSAQANLTKIAPFDVSEEYYENANLRLIFWKKSFCLIREHPVLGVGAGNWRVAVPGCRDPVNPEHTIKNYTYSQPHNEWICFLSETGIVGLLLALAIFILPVAIILYRLFSGRSRPPVAAVFYTSFIAGFYIYAMFDFPLRRVEHNILLFSLLAFLILKTPLRMTEPLVRPKIPAALFSTLFMILALCSVILAGIRIRSEYYTLKMFRNERKNDSEVIRCCRKAGNALYRITPNTLPVAWFEGVAWYRRGHIDSAIPCFERALRFTPFEVRALNDYGISLFGITQTDKAKSVLLRSIRIDPFFDEARFNLAAIHYLTGRRDSALWYVRSCRDCRKKEEYLNIMMNDE